MRADTAARRSRRRARICVASCQACSRNSRSMLRQNAFSTRSAITRSESVAGALIGSVQLGDAGAGNRVMRSAAVYGYVVGTRPARVLCATPCRALVPGTPMHH